ncbi:metallophosphoesterase [Terrarubrum flagellatum]|uniref:metallophosphoesterase n=1 Tax=Terrirubrum flagellatum TaxID=2895980 RepID=UPI00314523DC
MPQNLTFIHLTDLHINAPSVQDDHLFSDTSATLRKILSEVKALAPQPKFIVASGDLTNRGDVESYQHLKSIFDEAALDIPVVWALGNHDRRAGFYRGMLGRAENLGAPYFHDRVIEGLHVIALDSSAPGKIGGSIEAEQFAWLESRLNDHPDLPKLLVSHHAPLLDEDDIEMEWEAISAPDTIRLRKLLAGRNVIGLLSGHIHFDRVSSWHGVPVVVGIGQHAATDVLSLHKGVRMVSGASFAIGTVRPSGLTVSFTPQPTDRRELHMITFAAMAELIAKYEAAAEAAE